MYCYHFTNTVCILIIIINTDETAKILRQMERIRPCLCEKFKRIDIAVGNSCLPECDRTCFEIEYYNNSHNNNS